MYPLDSPMMIRCMYYVIAFKKAEDKELDAYRNHADIERALACSNTSTNESLLLAFEKTGKVLEACQKELSEAHTTLNDFAVATCFSSAKSAVIYYEDHKRRVYDETLRRMSFVEI